MKKCPYCAEKVQDEAIVCRFCGRSIGPARPGQPSTQQRPQFAADDGTPRSENGAAGAQRAARAPRWGRIWTAVSLAGAIPIALSAMVLALFGAVGADSLPGGLYALVYAIYLLVVFLFHLVPLPLGFWAGLAWPGTHLRGHAALGLSAGAIEVATGWAISNFVTAVPLRTIDYMFALGTVSLFIAGGLFGDVFEKVLGWRRFMDLRRISQLWRPKALDHGYRARHGGTGGEVPTERTPHPEASDRTDKPSEPITAPQNTGSANPQQETPDEATDDQTSGFSPKQILLIQTMVPGAFTLAGTTITALATLLKAAP